MIHPNKEIMQKAIDLAREKYKEGGHAVATIIVKNNELLAKLSLPSGEIMTLLVMQRLMP